MSVGKDTSPSDPYKYIRNLLRKKTDRFIFSEGDLELFDRFYLPMANPVWNFTSADYSHGDDCVKSEPKPEVDEEALNLLISRIIWSATANTGEDDTIGINALTDGSIEDMGYTATCIPSAPKEKKNKSRKSRRRTSGRKENVEAEAPVVPAGAVRGCAESGVEMILLPLEQFRNSVVAEVESVARRVYGYFEQQLMDFDTLRINSLRDAFYWNERSRMADDVLTEKNEIISSLRSELGSIQSKIEDDRMQKRRRRQDRKQRRKSGRTSPMSDVTMPAQNRDDVDTCDANKGDANIQDTNTRDSNTCDDTNHLRSDYEDNGQCASIQ